MIIDCLINRGWFNCGRSEGPEVDSDRTNGYSGDSEEVEESRESGHNFSWACQRREEGREEGRKERGEEGREEGREEGGEEGRKERGKEISRRWSSINPTCYFLVILFIYIHTYVKGLLEIRF